MKSEPEEIISQIEALLPAQRRQLLRQLKAMDCWSRRYYSPTATPSR